MLNSKLLSLVGALALATLIAGSGSARADEIYIGTLTPSPGGCTLTGSDEGYVCSGQQTFTAEGATLTATGYNGVFATQENLTLKTVGTNGSGGTANSFGESGLGENMKGAGNPCDDPVTGVGANAESCEIGPGKSVSVSSTIGITDLIVGSVQPDAEVFQLYAATTGTTLNSSDLINTYSSAGGMNIDSISSVACPNYDGSNTCTFNFSTPYSVVGIVELGGIPNAGTPTEQNASDSLITAVSIVPAPPIGHGLPVVIAVGGLLFGVWAWDRSKKRRLLGAAATARAAA